MAIEYTIAELDIHNPDAILRYERALFRAFVPVWTNTSDRIFIIDRQEKRVRSRIGYADQEIVAIEAEGTIVGGFAVNYDRKGALQLELLGFNIDRSERFCEALVLFNIGDLNVAAQLLNIGKQRLFERMAAHDSDVIYGTSNKKNARAYTSLGFTVADTFTVDGQEKFLLVARG
jgi:hypothetical protein